MGCLLLELNIYEKQMRITQELKEKYENDISKKLKSKIEFHD